MQTHNDYGALELKRSYQHNFGLGTVIAALVAISATGGFKLYRYLSQEVVDPIGSVRIVKTTSDLAAPPSMTAAKPQVNVAEPNIAPPSIGIPTPVPDEEVVEEVRFATKDELAQMNPTVGTEGNNTGDSVVFDPNFNTEDYFPAADKFVAVQEMPTVVKEERPLYPEVAQLTKQEGTVWVKALIDKEGKVREARIAKSSGKNVGFDESALEAAYKNFYKPAIQNGKPVVIWVTYAVEFKLK